MKYILFLLFFLKTSLTFSQDQYSEYEDYGRQCAKIHISDDLLTQIKFIKSEMSFMEAYNLRTEKYYFFKGAYDFYYKYYYLVYQDD
jgi:hypothetical protein